LFFGKKKNGVQIMKTRSDGIIECSESVEKRKRKNDSMMIDCPPVKKIVVDTEKTLKNLKLLQKVINKSKVSTDEIIISPGRENVTPKIIGVDGPGITKTKKRKFDGGYTYDEPESSNKKVMAPSVLNELKRCRMTKKIIDDKGDDEVFCDSFIWKRLVCIVDEFGIKGRIMAARIIDGPEIWMRLKVLLSLVNSQFEISNKSTVYLAFGNSKVIGICVAVPLEEARRFCSTELLDDPVKVM
jgi:hypothetical protein